MSINIVESVELRDFEAWSGGYAVLEELKMLDVVDEAQAKIEEMTEGKTISATELNDILWFELDDFVRACEEKQEKQAEFEQRTEELESKYEQGNELDTLLDALYAEYEGTL